MRPHLPPLLVTVPFVAALWLPLLDRVHRLDPTPDMEENRRRAELPAWPRSWAELSKVPAAYGAYDSDHVGFRDFFIMTHGVLKLGVLGMSPTEKVIVAKDGFLVHVGESALDAYRVRRPMGPAVLASWAGVLEERRAALAARGIPFVVLIAPEKPTVYPDVMPDYLAPLHRQSRMDQLVAHLRATTGVTVVDVRPALSEARRDGLVYYRLDTHWTGLGSYVVYRELLVAIGRQLPAVAPHERSAFARKDVFRNGGDLAILCGLRGVMGEQAELWQRTRRRAAPSEDPVIPTRQIPPGLAPFAWEVPDAALPRALVWHDSFFINLIPFVAEHFSRVACVRNTFQPFDLALVESERADVVVLEIAERYLERPRPPR